MTLIEKLIIDFANWIWGTPLLVLLLGGGSFLLIYSRFLPFKYFVHAINVLMGKYDDPNDPGQINHFEALSTALAATVGMGNISGVAIAIATGGPGAIFWMWMVAIIGISTKFFTCSLAVMYRGRDSQGVLQGGPMYVITEGLGKKWKPLALLFCFAGLFGCLPIFQANQLTEVLHDSLIVPSGLEETFSSRLMVGLTITAIVSTVIFGGIHRIAKVTSRMVPAMVVLYFLAVSYILLMNISDLPGYLMLIITDAFSAGFYSGDSVMGGALGGLIILGARRAAFSNEAGIGTAPMAHGAAKTNEPIREGLVAMLGPAIDTLIVCTLTALAILVTGVWKTGDESGISLTVNAFQSAMPGMGKEILVICVLIFSMSTMFSFSYYGEKCFSFIAGAGQKRIYRVVFVATIVIAAIASLDAVESLISGSFALMSIPTMISTLILAPRVLEKAKVYFREKV